MILHIFPPPLTRMPAYPKPPPINCINTKAAFNSWEISCCLWGVPSREQVTETSRSIFHAISEHLTAGAGVKHPSPGGGMHLQPKPLGDLCIETALMPEQKGAAHRHQVQARHALPCRRTPHILERQRSALGLKIMFRKKSREQVDSPLQVRR